jgi:hypothetical protein
VLPDIRDTGSYHSRIGTPDRQLHAYHPVSTLTHSLSHSHNRSSQSLFLSFTPTIYLAAHSLRK